MPRFFLIQSRAAGVVALVLGFQTRASAQADELRAATLDKVRIEYRAPPECPDIDAFKRLISSRVPEVWEAAPEESARRVVVVEVSGVEGQYAATVELAGERGERGAKTVSGALCANVVDGIALVTALAIQSRAADEPDTSEPAVAPTGTTPAGLPGAAPTTPAGAAPTAAPAGEAARDVLPSGATRDQAPIRTARDARSTAGLRASLRAVAASGVGPNAAAGVGLGLVYEPRGARIGLTVQGLRTARTEAQGVSARFELWSARVEGCPVVLVLAGWASFEPCPFAALGAIAGRAYEDPPTVIRGTHGIAPWFSVGGLGRAVGRFGRFVIEIEAVVGAPLRRERFYVVRGDEIHRVPAFYGGAAAGLGVQF